MSIDKESAVAIADLCRQEGHRLSLHPKLNFTPGQVAEAETAMFLVAMFALKLAREMDAKQKGTP